MDDLHIIGIGSSAGGMNALFEFFQNLKDKPNAAIVLIPHLDRVHHSFLTQIISKKTFLETKTIKDGERLEANRIYVLPENRKAYMRNGNIYLSERPVDEKINKAIDDFFLSLAQDQKENAIGIILSGLGSDGTRGAIEIKANGGMVMAQEPITAQFQSMPLNIISNDHPDFILAPFKMPKELLKYLEYKASEKKSNLAN